MLTTALTLVRSDDNVQDAAGMAKQHGTPGVLGFSRTVASLGDC